jgi:preprotein translocase subunit SecY
MRLLLSVFFLFILYRLGNFIAIPFAFDNNGMLSTLLLTVTKTGVLNQQALKRMSLFSLGIVPYITSGILIQLLKFLFAETAYGSNLKNKNYLSRQTLVYAFFISVFQSVVFIKVSLDSFIFFEFFVMVTILVAGSFSMIWFAKIITSFGFGNGTSILIMLSIIEQLSTSFTDVVYSMSFGQISFFEFSGHFLYILIFFGFISLVELSFRGLKLSYPSTKFRDGYHKGKKIDILPLKINNSGVLPLIFSMSFVALLSTSLVPYIYISFGYDISILLTFVTLGFIIFFIIFYTPFVINTEDISNNLKKSNIILENRRPGTITKSYLDKVINSLNYIAVLYLSSMVIIPDILLYYGFNVLVSGVSAVILVVVVIDIIKRIQYMNYSNKSQMMVN